MAAGFHLSFTGTLTYGKGKADGPTVDAALLAELDALEVNAKQGKKYGFEVCSAPIKDKK